MTFAIEYNPTTLSQDDVVRLVCAKFTGAGINSLSINLRQRIECSDIVLIDRY